MKRFNNFIADKMASFMATMLLFWVLLILDVAGAIFDPPTNLQGWLLWAVSILFQSIALPVLALVSNKQGERMEKMLKETHDTVMSELKEMRDIHKEVHTVVNNIHVQSQHNTQDIANALANALKGRNYGA